MSEPQRPDWPQPFLDSEGGDHHAATWPPRLARAIQREVDDFWRGWGIIETWLVGRAENRR